MLQGVKPPAVQIDRALAERQLRGQDNNCALGSGLAGLLSSVCFLFLGQQDLT